MFRLACCAVVLLASCDAAAPTPSLDPVIAQVAGQQVHQSLYTLRLTSAMTQVSQAGGPSQNPQMQTQIARAVFRGLILDAVVAQGAYDLNLYPSPSDVAKEVAKDATAAGGTPGLESQAAEAGTSLTGINDEVLSRLTEQAVEDHFASQRADNIYNQFRAGKDFATLAKQFSDDATSAANGGDLGVITNTQLASTSKVYQQDVNGLFVGGLTEIREAAGYDIIRLDAVVDSGKHLSHILIAAPKPYTTKERPAWFQETVVNQLLAYCQSNQVKVYLAQMPSPCLFASPSASPS